MEDEIVPREQGPEQGLEDAVEVDLGGFRNVKIASGAGLTWSIHASKNREKKL
jgi:hypothetical protein